MMRSVVITGADGFIGRHLVRCFANEGFSVYAITIKDSPLVNTIENIENVHIFQESLLNWDEFCWQLPQNPNAFIHLAWGGVSPDQRDNVALQNDNIALALKAVRLAATLHAQRFILPGSTMEYAYSGQLINSQTCPSPQNAYGAAKIAVRYLCGASCEELHIPFICTVISGIYAPDRRDNNVIYYTIRTLLEGQKPKLTRLEQKWDYVHIDDVAHAFLLIAQKGRAGAFYAIGHGDNCPLSEYILTIRDLINPDLSLGIGEIPYKDARLPSSCVDLSAIHDDTGYIPSIPFRQGIAEVIDSIREELRQ